MTHEALPPEGQPTPVDLARTSFNKTLLSPDYDGAKLMAQLNSYQGVLLGSDLTPEKVYHELDVVSGQAKEKSRGAGDLTFSNLFEQMQANFRQTHDRFTSKPAGLIQSPAAPTPTETKPPMTAAKGGASREGVSEPRDSSALTKREAEIVEILKAPGAEFYSASEIAAKTGLAANSVQAYLSKLRAKGVPVENVMEFGSRKVKGFRISSEQSDQALEESEQEQSGSDSEETTDGSTDQSAE